MSLCCFCFGEKRVSGDTQDVSMRKESSSHYRSFLKESTEKQPLNSTQSSFPETQEGSPDNIPSYSSSQPTHPIASLEPSKPYLPHLYLPSTDSFLPCSEHVLTHFKDFDRILDLESSSDWEVKIDKPFACIMIRTGTEDHPNIPVMKAHFDLELDCEAQDLFDVIYNTEVRKKWDSAIGAYSEILREDHDVVHYYMMNKAPWPFKDRDFVEVRYIRRRTNGDMEVVFMADTREEHPENHEKAIRGETVIGGQIFRRRVSPVTGKMTLMATMICQADMKGEVPKKLIKVTLPSSMLKWYRGMKKQLQMSIHEKPTE